MKNKLALLFISSLILTCAARADMYSAIDGSDFTGEAYFSSPSYDYTGEPRAKSNHHATPPLKNLRLKVQNKFAEREDANSQFAPTGAEPYQGEIETSEFASQELTEDFDDMSSDGFEADEESINEKRKAKLFKKKAKAVQAENTEDIILDCDVIDYDTQNYVIYAKGNVSVEFVKQKAVVKANTITFDRANNTVKAEGDVQIVKQGKTITGDYIFVDLNEENALIENPMTQTANIEMKAKKGYVYGDKIVQEDGYINVDKSFPIDFRTGGGQGPKLRQMMVPKDQTLSNDMEKGIIKLDAKTIKITQKGDLETIAIKKGHLQKGSRTIFKVPAIKLYTNKTHDYLESNIWEIGAYRGLGVYTGPGWVFELPKGSVLKAMPILNYKSGFGFGGLGRFSSGTNQTIAGYGTAENKVVLYGRQELDDNLWLQYGVNGYMDEWFLGRRRPKYGVSLVYNKSYASKDFLLKGRTSYFEHRAEAGYFQDLDFDNHFERLAGRNIGTTRFRYMAYGNQNFIEYRDPEKLKAFTFGVSAQLSAALYGTGDTQVIGRIGPLMHMQYKRWMQDIGYFFAEYSDNTPMPVFDAYRYGTQNLYLRESLRICKWLTVSWFGSFNTSNDSADNRHTQGNAFFISVGPDDLKFSVGYDFIRQNLRCTVDVLMDAKGSKIKYETLEIKQDKKASKEEKPKPKTVANQNLAPVTPKVLQKAVVEDIKVMDDVL